MEILDEKAEQVANEAQTAQATSVATTTVTQPTTPAVTPAVTASQKEDEVEEELLKDRRQKDFQREQVEKAEKQFSINHAGLAFTKYEDAQAFIDKILSSRWWSSRYQRLLRTATVEVNKDEKTVEIDRMGFNASFKIPLNGLNEFNIIKCLAKASIDRLVPFNGQENIRTMLDIVKKFMGESYAKELKSCYKNNSVKINLPKKKTEA